MSIINYSTLLHIVDLIHSFLLPMVHLRTNILTDLLSFNLTYFYPFRSWTVLIFAVIYVNDIIMSMFALLLFLIAFAYHQQIIHCLITALKSNVAEHLLTNMTTLRSFFILGKLLVRWTLLNVQFVYKIYYSWFYYCPGILFSKKIELYWFRSTRVCWVLRTPSTH